MMKTHFKYTAEKRSGEPSMLLQFRFKNYRSFADETVLDMTASSNCRELPGFVHEDENGNKTLHVAAIYGANASGKSNVIWALGSLRNLVCSLYTDEDKRVSRILTSPYALDKDLKDSPTEYEIFILCGPHEYRYGLKVTKDRILQEWLYRKGSTKYAEVETMLFEREENEIELNQLPEEASLLKNLVSENTTFLYLLGKKEISFAKDVYNTIFSILAFTVNAWEDLTEIHQVLGRALQEDKDFKSFCMDILQKADPCIIDVYSQYEEDINQRGVYKIFATHKNADDSISHFPLKAESDGTQKLLSLLLAMGIVLNGGTEKLLVIDEIDIKLHPLLLRQLVAMFHDPAVNVGKGQLILTAHNTVLLDGECLRRDEIWFTEKQTSGKSRLYSLADFKGIGGKTPRSDLSYMRNYLNGRFGAVPFRPVED